jgi:hypothetical protein
MDASCDLWRAINGTRGMVRLISQTEMPQAPSHGPVEELLARTIASGAMVWRPTFKTGHAVRNAGRSLADLVGKFELLDVQDACAYCSSCSDGQFL